MVCWRWHRIKQKSFLEWAINFNDHLDMTLFFILKNDRHNPVLWSRIQNLHESLFFPFEFMIWNLELEKNVICGLVCFRPYTLSLRVLCISLLVEKLVEKLPRSDWPFLGWHRWFHCSTRCAVIVVCTGGEWGKVFEGGPEPRAESQSTTGNLSKWRMVGGEKQHVRSGELRVFASNPRWSAQQLCARER